VKNVLLSLLGRLGLLRPAYRGYEALRSLTPSDKLLRGEDGLPLPPARLRTRVAGTPDPAWFLEGGRLAAESIRGALPVPLESLDGVLDFGCGCGRVVRQWRGLEGVHGSDYNSELVAWCRANLPGRFEVNAVEPPLPFEDGSFDLVYSLSVFTHLPEPTQEAWLEELHRVSRRFVLLSAHGDAYRERLTPAELESYNAGEVVVRWGGVAGTNLCTTFHPPGSVARLAGERFEVVLFAPEGAKGNPQQDLYLLERR